MLDEHAACVSSCERQLPNSSRKKAAEDILDYI